MISGCDIADPQVEPEAFARRPSLTEEQKVAMLGRPRLGETTRLQIRVKESKEFKVSPAVSAPKQNPPEPGTSVPWFTGGILSRHEFLAWEIVESAPAILPSDSKNKSARRC